MLYMLDIAVGCFIVHVERVDFWNDYKLNAYKP